MLLAEYNEVETMELFKEEGRQEGRQEGWNDGIKVGRQEGRQEGQFQMLADLAGEKIITIEQAAVKAGMSVEEFLNKMKVA